MTDPRISASEVAIVGMAGRFPGATNLAEYWDNLRAGVESITFFSPEELLASGVDPAQIDRPDYVRAAPVLDDPSLFDAAFFGYSPREAQTIDPQHRLFLECAWAALEHAGYDAERHAGPIGVFGGSAINSYLLFSGLLPRFTDEYVLTLTASDKDFLATRVSYKLNLTGPSLTVQTACSTSLVAVHLARQSLLDGECDMALAGGVSVRVPHRAGYRFVDGGIVSADGHCRPFDAAAGGTIFGSGVGIVVLKRLSDALEARDTVHAVIKGSAINNDGASKATYSAPSVTRQAAAMVEALGNAGVDAATISYVETHGTGTRLGDPIEVAALTQAFRAFTPATGFCAIGSVKSNIGHMDAAAGVAGLIKTVLALEHAEIPASLHFSTPNPEIDFARTPFRVNDRLSPWRPGFARRAMVNALGVGGTNAHLVIEEAPGPPPQRPPRSVQLLALSARTAGALGAATSALADHLERHPDQPLADVACTLQIGRRAFAHRRAVLCRERGDAVHSLRTLDPSRVWNGRSEEPAEVVFLVPGQGAQRPGMGLELYRTEPVFRAAVNRCAALFRRHLSTDLRDILYPGDDRLDQTVFAQPALFTISCAMAALWSSWGLHPVALLGHSIGELVAAHLAGVFSLEDAVVLVAARGLLMQELPPGAMLAVPLSADALSDTLDERVAIVGINGPSQCIVAGDVAAVHALQHRLAERGVAAHRLPVSRAFHSPMMDPITEPLLERVRGLALRPPRIPLVSNVTGTWIRSDEATAPEYWAGHLRHAVQLEAGFRTLAERAAPILLEIGPGHVLSSLAKQQLRVLPALASLPPPDDGRTELDGLLRTVGRLWVAGAGLDWARFAVSERHDRVPLPTYAFERERFWVDPEPATSAIRTPAPSAPAPRVDREPAPARSDAPRTGAGGDVPDHVAPRTPTEAAIAVVWQSVLGDLRIGVRDNFYRLGGHSILLPELARRLSAAFRIDVPLLTVMEAPTVEELADRIETVFQLQRQAAPGPDGRRA